MWLKMSCEFICQNLTNILTLYLKMWLCLLIWHFISQCDIISFNDFFILNFFSQLKSHCDIQTQLHLFFFLFFFVLWGRKQAFINGALVELAVYVECSGSRHWVQQWCGLMPALLSLCLHLSISLSHSLHCSTTVYAIVGAHLKVFMERKW